MNELDEDINNEDHEECVNKGKKMIKLVMMELVMNAMKVCLILIKMWM